MDGPKAALLEELKVRVSIIVTCYNRQQFIGRAVRSALTQSFPATDYEVVVVDDGSTDSSRKIIEDFGDKIVPVFHDQNLGLPAARNTGIRRALGQYVVHLDSDDYIHDELIHIEAMHLGMNPEWGAVECDYYEVDDRERHLRRGDALSAPIACGIMFRKDRLIEIGLYDEDMLLCEDEELRQRFESKYTIGHVSLPLYRYTRHQHNMTNDRESMAHYRAKIKAGDR